MPGTRTAGARRTFCQSAAVFMALIWSLTLIGVWAASEKQAWAESRKSHDLAGTAPGTVRVLLFSKRRPTSVTLAKEKEGESAGKVRLTAVGNSVSVTQGSRGSQETRRRFQSGQGSWRVNFESGESALVDGSLEVTAARGVLRLVGTLALEDYVARTAASETLPGTPDAALQAQAVAARTYALSAHRQQRQRHPPDADLCDLAHCQVLSFDAAPEHLAAARRAAQATAGEVLRLKASGKLGAPLFHAACGGATSLASDVFDGRDDTGSAAVRDPGCTSSDTWSTEVSDADVAAVLRSVWGGNSSRGDASGRSEPAAGGQSGAESPENGSPALDRLQLIRDAGGRVIHIRHPESGRGLSGEAFVRRLGARIGYGRIPSAMFWVRRGASGKLILQGRGKGHGVGLCQRGASEMAASGSNYRQILQRYFPGAEGERWMGPKAPLRSYDSSGSAQRPGK